MAKVRILNEGIAHIEDLDLDAFMNTLKNLKNMKIQEKLDGANLWTGIDEDGRFFTSREGKRQNAERKYEESEWPHIGAFDQFRAAHLALSQKEGELKQVLSPGDTVEVEVLYGAQPNSVMYGAEDSSFIAFLRGVNETPDEKADKLGLALKNQQVKVKFQAVDTDDGETLTQTETEVTFRFVTPQEVPADKIKELDISSDLKALEKFLGEPSSIEPMTKGELCQVQLTSVPKQDRERFKAAREEVRAELQENKLKIKQTLLDALVKNHRSSLSKPDGKPGIEGVVLRSEDGTQVKIVDKEDFTETNKFNQNYRAKIQGSVNTVDPDAPIEERGGVMGELRIKIADEIGNAELAKPAAMRKAMTPFKGATPEETVKSFANSLNIRDFQAFKKKLLALTAESAKELKELLAEFKETKGAADGKEISDETYKKTLVTFAEARRNLELLFDKLKACDSVAKTIALLYGNQAKSVNLNENLFESKGELDVSNFKHKSLYDLVNSYVANALMAFVIWHENDRIGMRALHDKQNWKLKKHAMTMSPLNHWGYVIWRAGTPDVKALIGEKNSNELKAVVKEIPRSHWKLMHMDFSYNKELDIDWVMARRTLKQLLSKTGLRTDQLNTFIDQCTKFSELEPEEKKRVLKHLITYVRRIQNRSMLFLRIKHILSTVDDEETVKESLLKKIAVLEDDAAPAPAVSTSVAAVGTTAASIASTPIRALGQRRTELRRRNPAVQELTKKFKNPNKDA